MHRRKKLHRTKVSIRINRVANFFSSSSFTLWRYQRRYRSRSIKGLPKKRRERRKKKKEKRKAKKQRITPSKQWESIKALKGTWLVRNTANFRAHYSVGENGPPPPPPPIGKKGLVNSRIPPSPCDGRRGRVKKRNERGGVTLKGIDSWRSEGKKGWLSIARTHLRARGVPHPSSFHTPSPLDFSWIGFPSRFLPNKFEGVPSS